MDKPLPRTRIRLAHLTTRFSLLKHSFYPWLVWGLAAAFFFFEYIARISPGVMVNHLMAEFHVSGFALGGISAFFYYAYVTMQIPVGVLVDRFGVQKLLTSMVLLTGLGCFLFGEASYLGYAEVGRFFMGFGSAFAFVSALKLVSVWFPPHKVGLLSGLTQALGMLGASVGEAPTAMLVASMGWRDSMKLMAIVFVVLAFLIAIIVRDKPVQLVFEESAHPSQDIPNNETSIRKNLAVVLSNSQTWFNALYVALLYAPTAAFAELWGVAYCERIYGLTTESAASAVGMIFLGWGIGGPIVGWISDKIRLRRPLLIGSALIGCILMSIVIFISHLPVWLLFILMFLYGVSNTGVAIAYAVAAEINPRSMAGTSLGFTNMASIIVGAFCQPIIGKVLDLQSGTKIIYGVYTYTDIAFRHAMSILPILLVFSIVLGLFIRETHCHAVAEN